MTRVPGSTSSQASKMAGEWEASTTQRPSAARWRSSSAKKAVQVWSRWRSGYHKGTGVYVDLDESLTGISVPDKPSDQDVENAKVLLEDVLYDFPWVTPADRTFAFYTS